MAMKIEVLQYIVFVPSILLCFLSYFWSEKLIEKSFYNKSAVAAIISTIIGIVLENADVFNLPFGMTTALMSLTTIYLLYFRVLHFVFLKWKGFDPQPMARVQDIGYYPLPPSFSKKKPKNKRTIILEDVVFTFLHLLVPIFTFIFLLAYLNGRFK